MKGLKSLKGVVCISAGFVSTTMEAKHCVRLWSLCKVGQKLEVAIFLKDDMLYSCGIMRENNYVELPINYRQDSTKSFIL